MIRQTILLLAFQSLLFINSNGQNGSILGFNPNTQGDTSSIIQHNINNHQNDTLFKLSNSFFIDNCCCASGSTLDPYNKRYFFSTDGGSIYSFDINDGIVDYVTNGLKCHSQHYDQFYNSLIYLSCDGVRNYHLDSSSYDLIAIPCANACVLGQASAYNFISGEFFYIQSNYPNNGIRWVLVDIINGNVKMDSVINDTMFFGSLIYSPVSDKYYGFNKGLYEVEPNNLSATKIINAPSDHFGSINFQNGTYDAVSHTYILPYGTMSLTNNVAVFDLHNDTVLQTFLFASNTGPGFEVGPNLNQFLSLTNEAYLVFRNGELLTTYGQEYDWYLNDTFLTTTITNKLVPIAFGKYHAVVSTENGNYISNDYYYYATSANDLSKHEINIFPNPAQNEITASFSTEDKNRIVEIISVDGKTLFQYEAPTNNMQLQTSAWNPGIYIIKVHDKTGVTIKKVMKL